MTVTEISDQSAASKSVHGPAESTMSRAESLIRERIHFSGFKVAFCNKMVSNLPSAGGAKGYQQRCLKVSR